MMALPPLSTSGGAFGLLGGSFATIAPSASCTRMRASLHSSYLAAVYGDGPMHEHALLLSPNQQTSISHCIGRQCLTCFAIVGRNMCDSVKFCMAVQSARPLARRQHTAPAAHPFRRWAPRRGPPVPPPAPRATSTADAERVGLMKEDDEVALLQLQMLHRDAVGSSRTQSPESTRGPVSVHEQQETGAAKSLTRSVLWRSMGLGRGSSVVTCSSVSRMSGSVFGGKMLRSISACDASARRSLLISTCTVL